MLIAVRLVLTFVNVVFDNFWKAKSMKVVLRKDVEKLGEAGSVQNVSGGYARNFLIPQGLAVYATEGELKVAAHNQAVKDRKIERQERELQSLADKIQGQVLTFEARASESGQLFGSIGSADIAQQLSEKIGEEIDRRKVELSDPIRTLGEHSVSVHLVGKLRSTVTVTVAGDIVIEEKAEEDVEAEGEETPETENVEVEAEVPEEAEEASEEETAAE